MWIHRITGYVKPGMMAEFLAWHVDRSLPPGWTARYLRPIAGEYASTKMVAEYTFADPDMFYGPAMQPVPLSETMRKVTEMGENRGTHELLEVLYEAPAQGPCGKWVDRRIVYVNRTADAIALMKSLRGLPVEGYSYRVSRPRTGLQRESILIGEFTFASLPAWEAAEAVWWATPEGAEVAAKWSGITQGQGIDELYRIVG